MLKCARSAVADVNSTARPSYVGPEIETKWRLSEIIPSHFELRVLHYFLIKERSDL